MGHMKRTDSLQRVILGVLAAGLAGGVVAGPAVVAPALAEPAVVAPAAVAPAVAEPGGIALAAIAGGDRANDARIIPVAVPNRDVPAVVDPARAVTADGAQPISSDPAPADGARPDPRDAAIRPVASSLLDLLPVQLNCLLSTGWAAFCLGLPRI